MARTIALVSCVKQKAARPAAARDLYTSALFKKMRQYAETTADTWYILSAQYGLVHPDTVIAPYEQTLKDLSAAARRVWAARVYEQLEAAGALTADVCFLWLAGQAYKQYLARLLAAFQQGDPLAGMRIGQLSFYELTTPSEHPYGSDEVGSKYQGQRGPTPSRIHEDF